MRHSSMKSSVKSIFAVLSVLITLLAVVPTASAAVQSAKESQVSRERDRGDEKNEERFAAVRRFINRALRRLGTNDGISIPIPSRNP